MQADALARSREQGELANAAVQVSGLNWSAHKALFDKSQEIFNAGPYPQGFENLTGQTLEQFDAKSSELLTNTSPKVQNYMRPHLAALRTSLGEGAMKQQALAQSELNKYSINAAATNYAAVLHDNPELIDVVLPAWQEANRNMSYPFLEKNAMEQKVTSLMAVNASNAFIRQNPGAASAPTRGQAALRAAEQNLGVATGLGTFPLQPPAPIIGTPINDTNPLVNDFPEAAIKEMSAAIDRGEPIKGRPIGAVPIYKDAAGKLRYGGAPAPAQAATPPEPPSPPPTDEELSTRIPGFKWLNPMQRQELRTKDAAQQNSSAAYQVKALNERIEADHAAAQVGEPAANPVDRTTWQRLDMWGSPQQITYDYMQTIAHANRQMRGERTTPELEAIRNALLPWDNAPAGVWREFSKTDSYIRKTTDANARSDLLTVQATMKGQYAMALAGQPYQRLPRERLAPVLAQDADAYDDYTKRMDAADAIASKNATNPQIQAALGSIRTSGDPLKAIDEIKDQALAGHAATQILKARQDDPAQAMQDSHPELSAEHDAAYGQKGTPQMMQAYLSHLEATQSNQIPGKAPMLMSLRDMGVLNTTLNGETEFGSPEKKLQAWRSVTERYGGRLSDVLQQFQQNNGKLPPEFRFADWIHKADGSNASQEAAAIQLMGMKQKDIETALGGESGGTVKFNQIQQQVEAQLQKIGVALGNQRGGPEQYAALVNVATRQAAMMVARGENARTAAENATLAARGMVKTFDTPSVFLRTMVPTDQQPDMVMTGAGIAKQLLATAELQVPPSNYSDQNLAKQQFSAVVQQKGAWINNDSHGLDLAYIDAGGRLSAILRADGRPVRYSFSQLRGMGGEFSGIPLALPRPALRSMRTTVP